MISLFKKTAFFFVASLIFAQATFAFDAWQPYPPALDIAQDITCLEKLSQWIYTDQETIEKTQYGYEGIFKNLFTLIMQSAAWNNFHNKTRKKNDVRDFLKFLRNSGVSREVLFLIQNPLINNNLYLVLRRMHDLGFNSSEIKSFNNFLLNFFAKEFCSDINALKQALVKNNTTEVLNLILKGIHPNWVVDHNLNTAIFIAMRDHNTKIIQLILACPEYNISAVNNENNTALMHSLWRQNKKIAYILINHTPFWMYDLENIYKENILTILAKRLPEAQLLKNCLFGAMEYAQSWLNQEHFEKDLVDPNLLA